tara:strand:+ start:6795 stop:9299 length:2505 start_codon:yes stop_codon:yes gene_type:complete
MGTTRKIQANGDTEFTLPSDYGDADQALTTNGAGALSWSTITAEAGGTGKNYISNPDGNTAITYWGVYADAAAETPADGTGGSAAVTITRNTTTPLSGAGDILMTKDAANRQGEGIQTDFTIDNADKGQKLLISFDYTTSANYADDDVGIFIYDVTNTSLTRVNGEGLKAVSGTGKHYAQFQAASDSTSYRLIFHVASTNASAYTINLDTVSVGPSKITHGAMVTDWTEYTPTITGFSTATNIKFFWKRLGDEMKIRGYFTSGTPEGGTDATIQLPSGYAFDTGKLGSSEAWQLGQFHGLDGTDFYTGSAQSGLLHYYSGSTNKMYMSNASANDTTIGSHRGNEIVTNSGESLLVEAQVPIAGWSANTQISQDYSGRDVVFRVTHQTATNVPHDTATTIPWDRTRDNIDTVNGYDASSNAYTIPETGYYDIGAKVAYASTQDWNTNEWSQVYLLVDGTITEISNTLESDIDTSVTLNFSNEINTIKYLTKGQAVSVQSYQNSTGTRSLDGDARMNWFCIAKRSSAQTVLNTSDPIICTARGLSGTTTHNSGDWYQVTNYNTPIVDTTNSWDSANDKYVIPETGYYDLSISVKIDEEASPYSMGACLVTYYLNGVQGDYFGQNYDNENTTVTSGAGRQLSGMLSIPAIHFQKGDELKIYAYYQGGDAQNEITTAAQYTWFSIAKRGAANTYINTDRTVACRATKDDVQSVPNASTTVIEYDDVDYDTHSAFNTGTNKYVVPVSGHYDIYAKMRYQDLDEQSGDNYQMYILVGGVNKSQISDEAGATNTTSRSLQIQDTLLLNKGDEVTIACYQATGGAEGTMAQATDMVFTIRKI